jgi:Tfp pilus assembly protein PilX
MKINDESKSKNGRSRGVALVMALLMLSLFSVMTLSMAIATTSDTLIDGYYRNARGSFYAADSGMNVARQYLINQFAASVPNPYTAFSTTVPVTSGAETTILSSLNNASSGFGGYQSILGSQTGSWAGSFKIDSANTTLGAPTCVVHYTSNAGTIPTCTNAGNGSATYYSYSYPYKLTVIGKSQSSEANTVQEQGTIMLTVNVVTNSTTTNNFAAWGMFIDQNTVCNGSYLVPGTITGPVFTNGGWTFGTSGSYIFTDAVGSHSANLGYQYSDGTCNSSPLHPNSHASQNINPTFQSSVYLNQPTISLPTDSFNQKRAVLDGQGLGTTDPTATEMNAVLKNISRTAYPTGGTSSGVYLPYNATGSGGTCPCNMTGGGIYVAGNATVTITASGATAQVYTIVNNSTTTTVTVNTSANTTTIQSGASTTTITGVPQQKDSTGAFQRNATMLYVNGNITALKGGGEGVGSIQDSTALDVVASGSVTVTGDIRYVHEPVTLAQSGSTPADTLISGNDHGQAFGIYTAGGNINLANTQSSNNLQIDASIAAISQGGSGGLVNTGSAINTLTIVGGRIQNTIQNINTTTRNVWFDRRYASGGFAPPWFPSTTVTTTTTYANPVPVVSASRNTWVNTTAQ